MAQTNHAKHLQRWRRRGWRCTARGNLSERRVGSLLGKGGSSNPDRSILVYRHESIVSGPFEFQKHPENPANELRTYRMPHHLVCVLLLIRKRGKDTWHDEEVAHGAHGLDPFPQQRCHEESPVADPQVSFPEHANIPTGLSKNTAETINTQP